jgi:hypothetical protein
MTEMPTALHTAPVTRGAARPDLCAPMHKALRHALGDTLVRVGRMDPGDDAAWQRTLDQLDDVLGLCEAHERVENALVHPFVESRAPGATLRTAAEHDEHRDHLTNLHAESARLRAAARCERAASAQRLYRHLALFAADAWRHMHVEEATLGALLWQHFDDAELLALHELVAASLGPEMLLRSARWMLPALTPAERAAALVDLRPRLPAAALASLGVDPLAACDPQAGPRRQSVNGAAARPGASGAPPVPRAAPAARGFTLRGADRTAPTIHSPPTRRPR